MASNPLDLEVVIPHGNPNAALHIRFAGDYATFCGRLCDGWIKSDTTIPQAIASAYTCKNCMKAMVK